MSIQNGTGWLPIAISSTAFAACVAVAASLVSLSPAQLTLDAYVARVAAHTLLIGVLGATAVTTASRALRTLRGGRARASHAPAWPLHGPLGSEREVRRAA